jgi:putative acetyltransferase
MSVVIRSESDKDREAIWALNREAFNRDAEANLVDAIRQSPGFVPSLSLVAEREGEIVGHALFSEAAIESTGGPLTVLALGPVAVRPAFQKQGIGGALIRAGVERGAALDYPAVLLIGHPTYYPRFGFLPGSRYGLKLNFSVPDDVFMALPLRPDGLDGIQGTFAFPPAFQGV